MAYDKDKDVLVEDLGNIPNTDATHGTGEEPEAEENF